MILRKREEMKRNGREKKEFNLNENYYKKTVRRVINPSFGTFTFDFIFVNHRPKKYTNINAN